MSPTSYQTALPRNHCYFSTVDSVSPAFTLSTASNLEAEYVSPLTQAVNQPRFLRSDMLRNQVLILVELQMDHSMDPVERSSFALVLTGPLDQWLLPGLFGLAIAALSSF